jgi:putative methionine-R-sulfoxide reductase with GAF domain
VANLQSERNRIQEEVRLVREELRRFQDEQTRLEDALGAIERENRDYSTRYVEVEAQNYNLMNLYVATLRLHGTLERAEVLAVITDIIVNLIGSEEIGVFVVDGDTLNLVNSIGIDARRWARVPLGSGIIGRAVQSGQAYVAGAASPGPRNAGEECLNAVIPLRRVNDVTGAIAVFRLLPHKPALEAFDHELLALLGGQVAMALHATSVPLHHARTGT